MSFPNAPARITHSPFGHPLLHIPKSPQLLLTGYTRSHRLLYKVALHHPFRPHSTPPTHLFLGIETPCPRTLRHFLTLKPGFPSPSMNPSSRIRLTANMSRNFLIESNEVRKAGDVGIPRHGSSLHHGMLRYRQISPLASIL